MATLGKAIAIAARIHANRVYGVEGDPYVMHCLGVMHHVSAARDDKKRIVAVLHAAVEEGRISLEALESEGFEPEVIEALRILPRRADESPAECARRVCTNQLARSVKLVDVAMHMQEDYCEGAPMDDPKQLEYSEVKAILVAGLNAP